MDNLLIEIVKKIACCDFEVYHTIILIRLCWSKIFSNTREAMDFFTKETVVVYNAYKMERLWKLPNNNLHRGNNLPALIHINFSVRNEHIIYTWYVNGIKFKQNDDANSITIDDTVEGFIVTKYWFVDNLSLERPNRLPSMERYSSNGKLIKREWYINGMSLLKSQTVEGTLIYKNGLIFDFDPLLTI